MKWHFSGNVTIHSSEGPDVEHVTGFFDLPNTNVKLIRDFLYANRDLILRYKYNPPGGEAPWGDVPSQIALRTELSNLMSDDEWSIGVATQTKAYLVAFYHQLLGNIDLYAPETALAAFKSVPYLLMSLEASITSSRSWPTTSRMPMSWMSSLMCC